MFAIFHHNGNRRMFCGIFETKEKAQDAIDRMVFPKGSEWWRDAYKIHEVPMNEIHRIS